MMSVEPWVRDRLVCPRDHQAFRTERDSLVCECGHRYLVRDQIPVLLLDDVEQTHEAAWYALHGEEEPEHFKSSRAVIDPFVQEAIGATGGYLYKELIGNLVEYPIPSLRLPHGNGRTFLDVGCSWGRWSIAAARSGYRVVGIDSSLVGVRAARRVANQLGIQASFIAADARFLPFKSGTFDTAFSYSVLQHFSKPDAAKALREIARVLGRNATSLIQLPNAFGIRSIYHQAKRRFREPRLFQVRYWTLPEIRRTCEAQIGPSTISIDGFFSLNAQAADLQFLPAKARMVVLASEALRRLGRIVPPMAYIADSLYVQSQRK
jgi:2-polyprenyl-3-methyl-5-hydroxy-6-metoxy-1,4-benzoquinol methylase